MRVGFTSMNTPDDVPATQLAAILESLGYDSLWVGEHSHIPASRRTPYPAGGEMPDQYLHMMDPFVTLTAAALSTSDLLLATGVCLPLEHDLFALAKSVATLDHISDGRLILGVGVGWNEEQLADHRPDLPWGKRYGALEEAVVALRSLWTEDEAGFDGEWFSFDGALSFPKPLQQPHPPIVYGAGGRVGTAQAAAWGDGWAPMDVALGDVERRVSSFRSAVTEGGRGEVPITLFVFGDPDPDDLRRYRDIGIERAVIGANRSGWGDPSTALPFIQRHAEMIPTLA